MASFGLLGEKLGHSFSPRIHAALADYDYGLYPVAVEELDSFLRSTALDGMNVTIPYKKSVIPYCSELSDCAKAIGSVNTLLRRGDGSWYGHNSDYAGFCYMLSELGLDVKGIKALVLGSGGASLTVQRVLADKGAGEVVVISRSGGNNYDNLHIHADAELIVNTTPLGTYPNNGTAAVSLEHFPKCRGVADLVYNPARTALLLDAEARGIAHVNGLGMLVAQAHESAELFAGHGIDPSLIAAIKAEIAAETRNVVLIGMPGCGKSRKGEALARMMGREFADADAYLEEKLGLSPAEIINTRGEEEFRREETAVLAELGARSGLVIATGGGCVTREENYPLLHQNAVIVWIQRPLGELAKKGRPLSAAMSAEEMYARRKKSYEAFADVTVSECGSIDAAAKAILEAIQ